MGLRFTTHEQDEQDGQRQRAQAGLPRPSRSHPLMRGFRASASVSDPSVCEIQMYDDIGSGFWSDGITAKSVKSEIDSNQNAKSIRISLNSPGGDAIEGCAIHSVLRDWANSQPERSVNVKVDGIAASAASVIAMAGDTVTMGIGSMMMVHQAWSRCTGYADDMRKNADVLDCISQSIAQVYSSKTGMAAESCLALMADETWMTAGDCVDKGFADDIAEETPDELETEDQAMAMARGFKLLASMKKVPEQLRRGHIDPGQRLVQCSSS